MLTFHKMHIWNGKKTKMVKPNSLYKSASKILQYSEISKTAPIYLMLTVLELIEG